jgi:8-oxo-dGTP pyrophosphatase MutT (NUDIX family)
MEDKSNDYSYTQTQYQTDYLLSVRNKNTQCAGFVVICKPQRKVLLVSTHNNAWGYPKGKKESKETLEECAFRELKEETGLTREEINVIDMETTFFNEITNKGMPSVRLYVATTDEIIKPKIEDIDELIAAQWVDYDEALKILTIKNRKQVLEHSFRKVFDQR